MLDYRKQKSIPPRQLLGRPAILHQTLSSLAVGSNVVPYKVVIDHCTTPVIDRLDLNAFASINQVFHADLPGIGVTNINHCLAALPLPPTPFRDSGYLAKHHGPYNRVLCAADLTQKLAAISAAGWITPSHAICVALSGEQSKLFTSPIPRLITPPFLETPKSPFVRHLFPDRGLSRNPVRSGKESKIKGKNTMPKYVIERDAPGIGKSSAEDLRAGAQKSCAVLKKLGTDIQWVESYITDDKVYCIYIAPNEQLLREHGKQGGFPVSRISQIRAMTDPVLAGA